MPQAAKQFSGIFISYRRDDSAGHAGRLYDQLAAHFGGGQIFMDIDYIEPGEDFVQVIEEAVGSCEILIALIGRSWLTGRNETGRRLDNPNDFVRLEIAAALARNVRVIPALVQGAQMPPPQDLPEDLLPLARRHAIELSDVRWKHDVEQLISVLKKILAGRAPVTIEESQSATDSQATPAHDARLKQPAAPSKQVKLAALIAIAVLMLIAVGVTLAVRMWMLSKKASSDAGQTRSDQQRGDNKYKGTITGSGGTITGSGEGVGSVQRGDAGNQQPQSIKNSIGMEFVQIPSGSFEMGSTSGDSDETPVHRVTIAKPFYMGKYEVTQAQWRKVMGNNPSHFKGDNLPVEQVSWNDAIVFIDKLNAQNFGYRYRLPSEAEWEYAARAGTTGDYAGDLDALAWYKNNSGGQTHPVGSKQPNAFGLFDMHGNVWEWCVDGYLDFYGEAPTDGSAWLGKDAPSYRVDRGGSWSTDAYSQRSSNRDFYTPNFRSNSYGFRVAAQ